MQAKETKLQDILEGTKQYVVPLFQRPYSWSTKEWDVLWRDLEELHEMETIRTHFIGSIVSMPTVSVPEGVAKYLLIDGQQRLTTIFIILSLIRNRAQELQNRIFSDEINNTLLVNQYKTGDDHYKLMPTQLDRDFFKKLIDFHRDETKNAIFDAYRYFERKLKQTTFDIEKLKRIITNHLSLVSIVLDPNDNPYLVFESLNAKGKPLQQADLIRNYFFMRISSSQQQQIYERYWLPIETVIKEQYLTEYIRHFLMKDGRVFEQSDIYYALKDAVNANNAIEYIEELQKFSLYYQCLLEPEKEPNLQIRNCLSRLNRIQVTTAYPLLLNIYHKYIQQTISAEQFVELLTIIENYLIRRFICNLPSHQLRKIFPTVIKECLNNGFTIEEIKKVLQEKGYPKDREFETRFRETKLYGASDRQTKTKLILESIEESFAHKESISFSNLTIEHIMPQQLSEAWQKQLGADYEETHNMYLHTIGNLTLTAYNSELSNDSYLEKKKILQNSHLEINKYFDTIEKWDLEEIQKRATVLAQKALTIWPYFGKEKYQSSEEVTGTVPKSLTILGQKIIVTSWRDVLEETLDTIHDLEPEKFDMILDGYPRYIGRDGSKFRSQRQLKNGYYIEVNLSATAIFQFCRQLLETVDLSAEHWSVEYQTR